MHNELHACCLTQWSYLETLAHPRSYVQDSTTHGASLMVKTKLVNTRTHKQYQNTH